MSTENFRISITLDESTFQLVFGLANQKRKSISNLVKELILEALERHEDMILSTIADACDKPGAKKVKHVAAWKR